MKALDKIYSMTSLVGSQNSIRDMWDRLSPYPGGKIAFSKWVGRLAPYTGSIDPYIKELEVGHALASMKDKKRLRNHLESLHAIALANLAELAGNLALVYSMPDDARFIVASISMDYLKKARGEIFAEGSCPKIESNEKKEYEVHVHLYDESKEIVAKAILHTLVGPKKD